MGYLRVLSGPIPPHQCGYLKKPYCPPPPPTTKLIRNQEETVRYIKERSSTKNYFQFQRSLWCSSSWWTDGPSRRTRTQRFGPCRTPRTSSGSTFSWLRLWSTKRNGGLTHPVHLREYTDKKRERNFPRILGNLDGIVCKSMYEEGLPNMYKRKCADIIKPHMRRPLVVYDFHPIPSVFPYIWGKLDFLFYQCRVKHNIFIEVS